MEDSSVSIITRTRDRPIALDRAIRSILGQQFQGWQLIVISDGGNLEVIKKVLSRYAAGMCGRCRLLHRDVSTGIEAAANFGIAQSKSRYVVLHDDDDSWHPQFLEKTVGFLRSSAPDIRGVFAGTQQVLERIDGDTISEVRRRNMTQPAGILSATYLHRRNAFPPIAFLYEREAGQEIGGYREELRALGDWDFNVRFASRFGIGHIPDIIAYWHQRPKLRRSSYANSSYRDHMDCLMRLKREWGEWPPLWRYLLWWRY